MIKGGGLKHVPCVEDEDFIQALDKMMLENLQVVNVALLKPFRRAARSKTLGRAAHSTFSMGHGRLELLTPACSGFLLLSQFSYLHLACEFVGL